jgi:hypothetical protein
MPRINRIRVTNIQYDNGKKQLPDITIEVSGLNTVLLLANGGGKTLLIQLIMQTILPNEKMSGRRIADLLQNNRYTGHVAVEWLLDDAARRHYLCAGFCFTSGQHNDQRLRYFNYLLDYDEQSELTIESLPLIKIDQQAMKRPINYLELRDFLKEEAGHRVQLFDQINTYHDRLRIYQILPEEWKNIRDTNGSEGGVDKFFEKSKTTPQLLDNLLIPSVEEMIFQSEQKKKELVHAFAEYRSMLLEIPLIKKNIKDFEAIRDYAEGVVSEVQQLDKLQREFDAKTRELVALAKTFALYEAKAVEAIDRLTDKNNRYGVELKELQWQEKSYQVYLKQLEYLQAKLTESKVATEYQEQQENLQKFQLYQNQVQALDAFANFKAAKLDINKYQTQLEIMDQSEPELTRELTARKAQLRIAWENKQQQLAKLIKQLSQQIEDIAAEIDALQLDNQVLQQQQTEWQQKLADVKAWLRQYYEHQQQLKQFIAETDIFKPEIGLDNQQKLLAKVESDQQATLKTIEHLTAQKDQLQQDIMSWREQKTLVQGEVNTVQEKINHFYRAEEELKGLLAGQQIFVANAMGERDNIILRVRDYLRVAQENRVMAQAELANLQEKWVQLEGRNYYIPHADLLRIKNRLEQVGVFVLLGSEWLAEQPISEPEKQAYLQHQPLLPYAIIIEENQLNAVKQSLKGRAWTQDIPLLFLVKSVNSLKVGSGSEQLLSLWNQELFLYQPEAVEIYTSTDRFQAYKDGLEQQVQQKQDSLQHLVDVEDSAAKFKSQVDAFYRQYNEQQLDAWNNGLLQGKQQINELAERIDSGQQLFNNLGEELKQAEQNFDQLRERQHHIKNVIEKLQVYLALYQQHQGKRSLEEECVTQLAAVAQQLTVVGKRKEELIETRSETKQRQRDTEKLLAEHDRDYRHYELEKALAANISAGNYEDIKVAVDSIIAQLTTKQSERNNIEDLLEKSKHQAERANDAIEDTGIEKSWLEQNQRVVTKEELKLAKEATKQQQRLVEQKKTELNAAINNTSVISGVLDHLMAEVEKLYNRSPYQDFSELDHQLEFKLIKQSIGELQEKQRHNERQIKKEFEWCNENKEAQEMITEKIAVDMHRLQEDVKPLTNHQWEQYQGKPKRVVRRIELVQEEMTKQIATQRNKVERKFDNYLQRLKTTQNAKVQQFIRDVQIIMDDKRLYDYDFVETQFLRIFEGLDSYQKQYYLTLQESEKNQELLINLCLRRAKTVYDSIMEIPKNSRVTIYQRDIQIIRMDWHSYNEQESREKMYRYLQQVLEDLQAWKQQGVDDDELDRRIEELLKTRNLIQVVAPIEDCRVTVYKPRKESIVTQHKLEYSLWDEVSRWSGGEEYSIYITMFMIMISHIRQQAQGKQKVWKVIVADNPFGRASSPHILETVFQVARSNRIQLICLTAHRQESILQRFPVVYSLQLRNAYGKEVMKAELMETGFYRYDSSDDGGAQMVFQI